LLKNETDMALRIRKNGQILCAAMHPIQEGDTYIGDGLHHAMAVTYQVIGAESMEKHKDSGEWWWMGNIPEGIEIDDFYKDI